MSRYPCETLDQRGDCQSPSIDEHKQHEFERQRNKHRRQHHHPQCHQDAGDHDINHQKRQKQQETDGKSRP